MSQGKGLEMGLEHTDPSYRQLFSVTGKVFWTQQQELGGARDLTPLDPCSGPNPENWAGSMEVEGSRANSAHEMQNLLLPQKLAAET